MKLCEVRDHDPYRLAMQPRGCRLAYRCTAGSRRFGNRRDGAATVELAILLPLLLFIVFGTIELTSRLFLRQTAAVTAYEGVRLAARRTVDAESVRVRCQQLLENRRVTGAQIVITPESTSEVATGGLIQVQIIIPYAGNTLSAMAIPDNGTMQVTASMLRE